MYKRRVKFFHFTLTSVWVKKKIMGYFGGPSKRIIRSMIGPILTNVNQVSPCPSMLFVIKLSVLNLTAAVAMLIVLWSTIFRINLCCKLNIMKNKDFALFTMYPQYLYGT